MDRSVVTASFGLVMVVAIGACHRPSATRRTAPSPPSADANVDHPPAPTPESPAPPRITPLVGAIDFVRGAMGETPWCVRTEHMGVVCMDGEVFDNRTYASQSITRSPRGDHPFVVNEEDSYGRFSVYTVDRDGVLRRSDTPWSEPENTPLDAPVPDASLPGTLALALIHGEGRMYEDGREVLSLDAQGHLRWGRIEEDRDGPTSGARPPLTALDLQVFEHTHSGNEFQGFTSWLAPACLLTAQGEVWCFAVHTFASARPSAADVIPRPVANLRGAAGFALGTTYGCAWTRDGALWCFASKSAGHSRQSDAEGAVQGRPMRFVAARVPWPAGVVDAAVGSGYLCARHDDGRVRCATVSGGEWFRAANVGAAYEIHGARGARAIAASGDRGCAILPDATVRCWGTSRGETGALTSRGFAPVPSLRDIARVVTSDLHACALDRVGVLRCWGSNAAGQIDGQSPVSFTTPHLVDCLGRVVDVIVGAAFTCALTDDHAVRCWGDNTSGQLGVAARDVHGPVVVPGLGEVAGLAAGMASACAWTPSGVLRCWGTRHAPQGRSVVIRGAGVVRQAVEVDDRWCARDDAGVVRCWRWSARAPALHTLDVGGAATRLFPGSGRWHGDYHEPSTLLLVRADGKLVGCRWEGDVADTAAFCEEVRDARGLVGARTVGNDSSTWWSGGVRRDPGHGDDIPAEPALRDAVDVQEAAVTCGLLRDGTVACGGRDREGQLADGEAPPEEARPVLVAIPAER